MLVTYTTPRLHREVPKGDGGCKDWENINRIIQRRASRCNSKAAIRLFYSGGGPALRDMLCGKATWGGYPGANSSSAVCNAQYFPIVLAFFPAMDTSKVIVVA